MARVYLPNGREVRASYCVPGYSIIVRGIYVEDVNALDHMPQGKTYVYNAHRYLFDVKVPAIVAAIAFLVAAYFAFTGMFAPIAIGVMVLCAYVLFNTLVARAYPQAVSVIDGELRLSSFGRTDSYRIDELSRLQVRENAMTHNAYIRVNGGGLLRGRYFVGCGDLYDEDGEKALDLYQFFLDTEARLDPENIRVRSRVVAERKETQKSADPANSKRKKK